MLTVVVYLKEDYSDYRVIYVAAGVDKNELREKINRNFKCWYYYQIINEIA